MLKFVQLYEASKQTDKENYLKDVIEGLSRDKKTLTNKYAYDKEGSQLFSEMNMLQDYYPNFSEKEIFTERSSDILATIGKEKFNFVELGAGDGLKTRVLIEQAVKEQYEFEYIPIDISHASNLQLADNIKKVSDKVDMTILTADYEDGVKWILENKKGRNVYFCLGNSLGNYLDEGIRSFMTWLKQFLKKDDIVILGLDMLKKYSIITKAYSMQQSVRAKMVMNMIKRINSELEGNFNLQQFYPYNYFDPQLRQVRGYIVSTCDQTVKIGDKQFNFKKSESIFIGLSRKFQGKDIEQLTVKPIGGQMVKYFEDKNEYYRVSFCKVL